MRKLWLTVLTALLGVICATPVRAQIASTPPAPPSSCLSADEVKKMLTLLKEPPPSANNEKLRSELLALKEDRLKEEASQDKTKPTEKKKSLTLVLDAREKSEDRLCTLFKENGWPTIGMVGSEAADANLYLLKNSGSIALQLALLPVIAEAIRKNEIEKNETYAAFIDRMRLRGGLKQLFGTQAIRDGDFLVLEPIEDPVNVDARRKLYGMGPLEIYVRSLERKYWLPLIKSSTIQGDAEAGQNKDALKRKVPAELVGGENPDGEELLNIETNLVSLDIGVHSLNVKDPANIASGLSQEDFRLFENGQEEKITFFSRTDVPFDLVLLIDLSGSTENKIDLIRKSTARFITAARPVDKIAIVTFADEINVVTPLTGDREQLLDGAKKIKDTGFSRVWDALQYSLQYVLGPKKLDRRRAVIFMTDGVDSSFGYSGSFGSRILFADLLETVRRSEAAVVPIYLDTEGSDSSSPRTYQNARNTLKKLADESGGLFYKAKKIDDLNGVYEKVLKDLSQVYSIGYSPSNEKRDGRWRSVKVTIPTHPELGVHTKAGYYAH